jgi:hypothetical protein
MQLQKKKNIKYKRSLSTLPSKVGLIESKKYERMLFVIGIVYKMSRNYKKRYFFLRGILGRGVDYKRGGLHSNTPTPCGRVRVAPPLPKKECFLRAGPYNHGLCNNVVDSSDKTSALDKLTNR